MTNLFDEDNEDESLPIVEIGDVEILMHRDVHFNGNFALMLDYYMRGGKGVQTGFDSRRIESLSIMEKALKQNLSPLFLTEADVEKVNAAKEKYEELRSLVRGNSAAKSYARLIAELILSEEEEPTEEIEAIRHSGPTIIKTLIELLHSDIYSDPLFPGYGFGPQLAAQCLGKIGDKSAIIALFEGIGEGDFFQEEQTLKALTHIGEPAKKFLLKVVHSRPITYDNERAAMALALFKHDEEIWNECLKQLEEPAVLASIPFATHLVLACEGMQDPTQRQRLMALLKNPHLPKMLKRDIEAVLKT